MGDNRPVGVMDSGFGGLSVLKQCMKLLPCESFVYYGDNANAPYGTKPQEEIERLAFAAADFLVQKGVKAIAIACNTATSAAVEDIRKRYKLPVLSMEPAIKPAIENSTGGKILMLATPATCALERYIKLKARLDNHAQVIDAGCIELVETIEKGDFSPGAFDEVIRQLLCPFDGLRIDGIVLGCTHFPFVSCEILAYARAHFQGECRLYDGAQGTARQLARVLQERILCADGRQRVQLFTSADEKTTLPIMQMLLRRKC